MATILLTGAPRSVADELTWKSVVERRRLTDLLHGLSLDCPKNWEWNISDQFVRFNDDEAICVVVIAIFTAALMSFSFRKIKGNRSSVSCRG